MVTFVGDNKELVKIVMDASPPKIITPPKTINMEPVWYGMQRDGRMWLWFPLVMEAECFGKTLAADWIKVYPRVIQWQDGKYYSFRGTHSAIPEYRIKSDNTVYYREILVENGEKVEYY